MIYELFNSDSGNMLDYYETKAEACNFFLKVLEEQGAEAFASFSFDSIDDKQFSALHGADIITWTVQRRTEGA